MYKTMGFNPFFHSSEFIAEKIKENDDFYKASKMSKDCIFMEQVVLVMI